MLKLASGYQASWGLPGHRSGRTAAGLLNSPTPRKQREDAMEGK